MMVRAFLMGGLYARQRPTATPETLEIPAKRPARHAALHRNVQKALFGGSFAA